ncbi:LOW QUALITY PROTEIN: 182 kDa tankyrase-1-binding protein [Aegotheles albertisi]
MASRCGGLSPRPPSPGPAMASQPLCPAVPCAPPAGTEKGAGPEERGAGGAGRACAGGAPRVRRCPALPPRGVSPPAGPARLKPPVRPKPHVLPKPAVPAKPPPAQPPPGPRHPRPELPSAEKMNRLAGPQPYGGGGVGGPLRRPSFAIKAPETPGTKGLPSPLPAAAEDPGLAPGEGLPPAPLTPSRRGPAPFKVTPVPVAAKPERFPGTTVEEILAKMDSREGPGSPERARLSPFCPETSRFGSRPFAAFRRRPSGEGDGAPPGESPRSPQPTVGEPGIGDDRRPTAKTSGSPPASLSCAGDPHGCQHLPSPPDLSSLQLGTLGPPGSPRPPTCPAPAPGAPFQPAEPPAPAPGSPDAPPELPAPGSPRPAPGSPEPPTQPHTGVPAPGAPSSTAQPQLILSRPPGSPHTPGEGSPGTASPPGTPELPPRATCPPGSPEGVAEPLDPPSLPPEPPAKASRPPGSPEGPDDPLVSLCSPEGPGGSPPPLARDSGLQCSSEGVLQPLTGRGGQAVLLDTLPRPREPLSEPPPGWGLSQASEGTVPSRGAQRLPSPPCSPPCSAASPGLSEEGDAAPCPPPWGGGSSEERGPTEGGPCPGGPVAQGEAEEEEEKEEGAAEGDTAVPCAPLAAMEPSWDSAQPETPRLLLEAAPPDQVPLDLATTATPPASLQGPGGPGRAEGPSRDPDPHADPGWLTELLASPGPHGTGHGSPENLLGWSRKDLCSEFGIGRAGAFNWTREAVSGERDWLGETEQDQEFGTKPSWDGARSGGEGDGQDGPFGTAPGGWGSGYEGTELVGDAGRCCSRWPQARDVGESCQQDRDFGAGEPQWGVGSQEERGCGEADWSHSYGLGHGRQRDPEPGLGQPGWASRFSTGEPKSCDRDIASAWAGERVTSDMGAKGRELTPDWARRYSSRDTRTEDFTLGWAGRSSTGDTGSPDKEFSPSRATWDSRYSPGDMESQDREFSPSRPARAGEHSPGDAGSQDQGFSPSGAAEAGEHSPGDTETRDQGFTSSRASWGDEQSSRAMESRDSGFSPSALAWGDGYGRRDAGSQDRGFSPSRAAEAGEHSPGDTETWDGEFRPSRAAWGDEQSTRDAEMWDNEFQPVRAAWGDGYGHRDMESQDGELSPGRAVEAGGHSPGDTETQDSRFGPSRTAWDERYSHRDGESQEPRSSAGGAAQASEPGSVGTEEAEGECGPSWLSWAGEHSGGRPQLPDAFSVGRGDMPGSPSPPAQGPGWGSTADPRDWSEGLRGAEPHSRFSTERAPEPSSTPPAGSVSWADGPGAEAPPEPLGTQHGGLPCAGLEEPGWSTEPLGDTAAARREWASAFGARCAARSWDPGEQSPDRDHGSAWGSILDPSLPASDAAPAAEPPWSEPPSPPEEQRDLPVPAAAPPSPPASPVPPETADGTLLDIESQEFPSDHPDGKRPPSWEEKRLSLGTPLPEGPGAQEQEFSFLEDTEVLDSSVYRSKASLGRKRPHRAPALRPATDGDAWIFQDSTEPQLCPPAASSDEEPAEEPKSRRVRASLSGRGVKVPLFPSLSTSALKAKLRGRNRSAEEGAATGDSKATPPRDPHVQRSKSCKIPGLGGKPPVLPPKPEKPSGSDVPPHWLQALKLKKKKP